jgi:hypothetical protein
MALADADRAGRDCEARVASEGDNLRARPAHAGEEFLRRLKRVGAGIGGPGGSRSLWASLSFAPNLPDLLHRGPRQHAIEVALQIYRQGDVLLRRPALDTEQRRIPDAEAVADHVIAAGKPRIEDGEALLNLLTALRPHRCRAEPRRLVDDVLGLEAARSAAARTGARSPGRESCPRPIRRLAVAMPLTISR